MMKTKLPVKLKALSEMTARHTKAHLLVRLFNVHTKKWRYELLAASEVADKRALRRKLLDAGMSRELSENEWLQIYAELSRTPEAYFVFCDRPGYISLNDELCYITTSAQIIGEHTGCPPFPAPDSKAFLGDESSQGTLKQWQKHVAEPALNSEYMILALCNAFAGYCIHFTSIGSGGFHFYGQSSGGKSTTLLVAASVRGSGNTISSWKMTDSGCEEIAEARNDGLLILDELKLLDRNPEEAARKAMDICYMLGDGRGKKRSAGYQKSPAFWHLAMLSAGELSLGQHANNGGLERMKGEEVRLVDIPVDDDQKYGVLGSNPESMDAGQFIELIQSQCGLYYGTAGPEFVRNLLIKDEDEIKARLKHLIEEFMKHHEMNHGDGGVLRRIALRFALAYASGVFAVRMKILPCTKSDIMKAISSCYYRAKKPVAVKKEKIFKEEFISELLSPNVLNIKSEGYSRDELESRDILAVTIKNQATLAVKKEVFKDALLTDERLLRQHDILFTDAMCRSTRQIPINGGYLSRRYCLKIEALRLFLY